MTRAMNDNALLAEVMRERWRVALNRVARDLAVCAGVGICGFATGGIWFLCLAVPAKALWK